MEVPDRGDSNNSHPLLVQLGRIKLDFVRYNYNGRVFAAIGIQAESLHAPSDHQPDIAIADFVPAASIDDGFHDVCV